MTYGLLVFIALSINPVGGLLVSIPFAIFTLARPAWLVFAIAVPCSYVQVLAVDLGWNQLNRLAGFRALLERRRSPRIERLVSSRGAFWSTALIAPLIGPWAVMAFMRYARVPQRRIALPILLGMSCIAAILIAICIYLPDPGAQLLRK